jgi:hypothetical protein
MVGVGVSGVNGLGGNTAGAGEAGTLNHTVCGLVSTAHEDPTIQQLANVTLQRVDSGENVDARGNRHFVA